MNLLNITKLRDHLVLIRDLKLNYKFNMEILVAWVFPEEKETEKDSSKEFNTLEQYYNFIEKTENHCGTAGCLAGWAAIMSGEKIGSIWDIGQNWLDLNISQSSYMFCGQWIDCSLDNITINEAIEYLELVINDENVFVKI